MCGSKASFMPTGTMFWALNSNCPTALVPALSSSCAAALSSTPVKMKAQLAAFTVFSR